MLAFPEYITLPPEALRFHSAVVDLLAFELYRLNDPVAMPRRREHDQKDPIIEAFYARFHGTTKPGHLASHMSSLQLAYTPLVRAVAKELGYKGAVFYQEVPNCRVQHPGDLAVGEWHTDAQYGHNPREVNVFVPIYGTNQYNTIHIDYKGQRKAYTVSQGQALAFMGGLWPHGNVLNASDQGRLSFDFRLLDPAHYKAGGASINGTRSFELGSYWQEMYI